MSTDAGASLDDVKERIRRLIREVAELTESAPDPGQYFPAFLQKVMSALAARGVVVWLMGPDGAWTPRYQVNIEALGLSGRDEPERFHPAALNHVAAEGEAAIYFPGQAVETTEGDSGPANETRLTLIFAPILVDGRAEGTLEVLQEADRNPQAYEGFASFAGQMARQAASFLRRLRLRTIQEEQQVWSGLIDVQSRMHDSLDPVRVAMNLANKGRDVVKADRISVAKYTGRKCKVLAVSGQDTVDKHGHLAKGVAAVGRAVCRDGKTLEFNATREADGSVVRPPELERPLEQFVAAGECRHAIVIPLQQDEQTVGALVAERVGDPSFSDVAKSHLDLMAHEGGVALGNALTYRTIPLLGLMRMIRWVWNRGPVKLGVVVAAVAAVVYVFGWVHVSLWLDGDARIVPAERRQIYVETDGIVDEVLVEHAQHVEKDATVLVLRNVELKLNHAKVGSEIFQGEQRIKQLEGQRQERPHDAQVAGELEQEKARLAGLRTEFQLLADQLKHLVIKSPIAGTITTTDVEKNLAGKPVKVGDKVLTVANTQGDWIVEVFMPEDRLGDILAAQAKATASNEKLQAIFFLKSEPERTFDGTVFYISSTAEPIEDENVVPMRIRPDKGVLDVDLKPDIGARAKVLCGKHPAGYVWFRELIQFFQTTFLF